MDWLSAQRPLLIGHRGASAYAPENSLMAFALAAEQGADGIEFDVQLSADGELVIIHDARVDRVTNGSGAVAKMSLAELKALDLGHEQTIPTLDELFQAFGTQLLYNVEIKSNGKGIETAVADRIQAYHLENHVLVSSFNPLSVRRARHALSAATMVALIRQPGWQQHLHHLASGEADHPHHSLVTEKYMAWARQKKYRIHVWTVDDPLIAQNLAQLGVHGIMTNKPDLIRDALHE